MFRKIMILRILSGITVAMLVWYIVSMFCSEAVMFLLSPFGIVVMFGYGCLAVGLVRLRSWAWGVLLIIVLATILMTTLFVIIGGSENMGNVMEGLSITFFLMSLFILPVFGISALVRKIARRLKERKKN